MINTLIVQIKCSELKLITKESYRTVDFMFIA